MSAAGAMTADIGAINPSAPGRVEPGAGIRRLGSASSLAVHGAAAAAPVVALLAPVLGGDADLLLTLAWVICIPFGIFMLMLVSAVRRDWGSEMRLLAAILSIAASIALVGPAGDAGVEIHGAAVAARLDPLAREFRRAVRRGDREWEVPPALRPLAGRAHVDVSVSDGAKTVSESDPFATAFAFVAGPGPVAAALRRATGRSVHDVRFMGGRWYAFKSALHEDD